MTASMSERGNQKLIAALVLFLAGAGGAAYWFFGVRAKNVQREAAQAEVIRWESKLAIARECLFGKTPASSDSGEAIAVRELTPDPWDRKSCTKAVGGIARGPAEDTGLMPVEHAWMTLDRAAAKVATAFAVSKDPFGRTAADDRRGVSELPDALRELDAAHAALRAAAGLPPKPSDAKVAALPVAQVVPVLLEGEEITRVDTFPRTSAGTLVVWGETKSTQVQLTFVPGAAPRLERVPRGTMRSITPNAAWAAAGLAGGVMAGAIDAQGVLGTPTQIAATGGTILSATGTLDDSTVAYVTSDPKLDSVVVFAHGKAGAFVTDKPLSAGTIEIGFDPLRGRALVAWEQAVSEEGEGNPVLGAVVATGAVTPLSLASEGALRVVCLDATHGYAQIGRDLVRFDGGSATSRPIPTDLWLAGCGENGALLAGQGTQYELCTAECRRVDLRGARPSEHSAIAGDHVVSVSVHDRVLAVWSEKNPPAFYRLPEKLSPRKVIADGKTIDVLAESGTEGKPQHFVMVRVPAT